MIAQLSQPQQPQSQYQEHQLHMIQQNPNDNENDYSGNEIDKLNDLLDNLVPTKDAIKLAKNWIMARPNQSKEIAVSFRSRIEKANDFDQRLNMVYLIHDILHHSARNRQPNETSDVFSEAFQSHIVTIMRVTCQGTNSDDQEKIAKVVRIWEEKGIFDANTLKVLDEELRSGRSHRSSHRERSRDDDDRHKGDRGERDRRESRGGSKDKDRDRKRSREKEHDRHDSKRRH